MLSNTVAGSAIEGNLRVHGNFGVSSYGIRFDSSTAGCRNLKPESLGHGFVLLLGEALHTACEGRLLLITTCSASIGGARVACVARA